MILAYNQEREKFHQSENQNPDEVIDFERKDISWSHHLKLRMVAGKKKEFSQENIRTVLYRPFIKEYIYYDDLFNEYLYQTRKIFPTENIKNLSICVSGVGARSQFTALMIDRLCSADFVEKGQCFPLFLFEKRKLEKDFFLDDLSAGLHQSCAITDQALEYFREVYNGKISSKEELFYYAYGILHSLDYRKKYAETLKSELPRIPRVKTYETFKAFSDAGRKLGEMHVNFDTQPIYQGVEINAGDKNLTSEDYRVTQMKYGKGKDKTILHYNDRVTVTGIPLEAYDYVVNGKPALDWVVERQCVKPDKASGIVNDANDWAIETMHNPRYPLELFLRVITISLETMKIVNNLPVLDILEN